MFVYRRIFYFRNYSLYKNEYKIFDNINRVIEFNIKNNNIINNINKHTTTVLDQTLLIRPRSHIT